MNSNSGASLGDTQTLIPELQAYFDAFQRARHDIGPLVDGVEHEQFNWRPAEDQWSMAECLDHLCSVGTAMVTNIDASIARAEENGWRSDGPFKYSAFGNLFVWLAGDRGDPPKIKFSAPSIYTPTSNHSVGRIQENFVTVQDGLLEQVRRANGIDLKRVKIPSPAASFVKLSLGQWFAMLAGHQRRHFRQAQRVKAMVQAQEW